MAKSEPAPQKKAPARKSTPVKAKAKGKVVRKAGRPSSFKPEFSEQAYRLCLMGATDGKLAEFFGVSEQTLNAWKTAHPQFLESLSDGKEKADSVIAESLFHRAKGYSHPEVDIRVVDHTIVKTRLTKHYPPDTQAASLWLRNRQPKLWRDKTDMELTGKDGGPIETRELSDAERAVRLAAFLASAQAGK